MCSDIHAMRLVRGLLHTLVKIPYILASVKYSVPHNDEIAQGFVLPIMSLPRGAVRYSSINDDVPKYKGLSESATYSSSEQYGAIPIK